MFLHVDQFGVCLQLLPVITPREENPRRASVHVVLNTECTGPPRRPYGGPHERRPEQRVDGLQGHMRQPHHCRVFQDDYRSSARGRRENTSAASTASTAGVQDCFDSAARGAGEAATQEATAPTEAGHGNDRLQSQCTGSAAAAAARAAAGNTSVIPGKILIRNISGCSWADPPTLRACPIQKYLAYTQHRFELHSLLPLLLTLLLLLFVLLVLRLLLCRSWLLRDVCCVWRRFSACGKSPPQNGSKPLAM